MSNWCDGSSMSSSTPKALGRGGGGGGGGSREYKAIA